LKYSRVSFCDDFFYDLLLRLLPSRTEYSRLAVHHSRNPSVLSLLLALLALCHCARVSYFSVLVQLCSSGSFKCWELLDWLQRPARFSRRTVLCGVSE
jgi:hypothetical protein